MTEEKDPEVHEIVLEPDAELRFEVESKSDTITLEVRHFYFIFCKKLLHEKYNTLF